MKDLIKMWRRRCDKYKKLAGDSQNELIIQGLLAYSEAYTLCADELERTIKELKP